MKKAFSLFYQKMILTSKNNPLVKETATLKEKKGRKESSLFLVEGVKMAKECLKSDCEIERVFLSQTYQGDTAFLTGLEEKIVWVSDEIMRYLCDEKTPQGVLCRVKMPVRELRAPTQSCVFLDDVADPKNVGAIIRTANASGYKEIYLTKSCANPYAPKSVRASMSGVFFTKIYIAERAEILACLQGVPLIVADMQGENAFTYTPPEKFALAIGNEANGISKETAGVASATVRIPMSETQESLNAAISAGILMYLLKKETFAE